MNSPQPRSTDNPRWIDLRSHLGHAIELVSYAADSENEEIAVECVDCNDVLLVETRRIEPVDRECRPSELIDYLYQLDDGDVVNDYVLDGFFEERAEKMKEE